ncbi:heterokaryon incompatibility protein-domain-containing protein [Jackrogersella minutella]|nr:heterokaryon incompatibility protein-domain-containing protein [Jackrogersella minutella]
MVLFTYRPFATEREIRLIDLLPGHGLIRCNLRHVSLSSQNDYESLSYCWGSRTKKVKMLVNGAHFYVTRNLHAALHRLRDAKNIRTLWIDAICINQESIPERNVQVPLMRAIYSSCRRVVIWLGEQDYHTKSAFEGLEYMAARFDAGEQRTIDIGDWKREKSGEKWNALWAQRYRLEKPIIVLAFQSIFERSWFTRVWIIQELFLGPEPLVQCGSFQTSWETLEKARLMANTVYDRYARFTTLRLYRQLWRDPTWNIFDHMLWGWKNKSSDPRDKIYAFLGLLPSDNTSLAVQVDYTTDVELIFIDFTIKYLLETHNLSILSNCRGLRSSGSSWVLNYEYDKNVDPLPEHTLSQYLTFKIGGDMAYQPLISKDKRFLCLQGYELDSITSVSPTPTPIPDIEERNTAIQRLRVEWIEISNFFRLYIHARRMSNVEEGIIYQHTGEPILKVLASVILLLGIVDSSEAAHFIQQFEEFDKIFVKAFKVTRAISMIECLRLCYMYARVHLGMSTDSNGDYIFSGVQMRAQFTRCRRFVTTKKGYMGLAPSKTEVGDKVILLQGHKGPVVSRPAGERWKLVGDCYLHGVMEGEVFDYDSCGLIWFE